MSVLIASWLLGVGCGFPWRADPAPRWRVQEAFDVPPPPDRVSLDLGPVASTRTFAPGTTVHLTHGTQTLRADVVDVQVRDDEVTLTVYAASDVAEGWVLAQDPVYVHVTN